MKAPTSVLPPCARDLLAPLVTAQAALDKANEGETWESGESSPAARASSALRYQAEILLREVADTLTALIEREERKVTP